MIESIALSSWMFFWTLLLYAAFYIFPQSRESFRKGLPLDFWVGVFVWMPPIITAFFCPLIYVLACLGIQVAYLLLFCRVHSAVSYFKTRSQGGRLMKTLSSSLGRWRVLAGFLATLLALPVFLVIRFGQVTVYPLLHFILGFPSYKSSEWIQLSRQKFEGLVGLDLLWCLYCEWSAGIYALGGEMVRNNESFWCPIRFYEDKHCENCRLDFPDLQEWIKPDGTMEDVEDLLKKKYPKDLKTRAWYQHSSRK